MRRDTNHLHFKRHRVIDVGMRKWCSYVIWPRHRTQDGQRIRGSRFCYTENDVCAAAKIIHISHGYCYITFQVNSFAFFVSFEINNSLRRT